MSFTRLLDMSNDSGLFRVCELLQQEGWVLDGSAFVRGSERYLPLYEAKMVHHYDHRFGDYAAKPEDSESTALPEVPLHQLADSSYQPLPRYWVPATEVDARLAGRWARNWLLGWRDICRSTDERTVIASVIPRVGVGNPFPIMLFGELRQASLLVANLSALVLDFVARQKAGGTHLNYFIFQQLAVLAPSTGDRPCPWSPGRTVGDWIGERVLELTYTAHDLAPFARDLGYDGPPFPWNPGRRFELRCQLDAAFFHLYALNRDDTAYILDTFPIVREKEERQFGEYRTKRRVLELFDEYALAWPTV